MWDIHQEPELLDCFNAFSNNGRSKGASKGGTEGDESDKFIDQPDCVFCDILDSEVARLMALDQSLVEENKKLNHDQVLAYREVMLM